MRVFLHDISRDTPNARGAIAPSKLFPHVFRGREEVVSFNPVFVFCFILYICLGFFFFLVTLSSSFLDAELLPACDKPPASGPC